MQIIIYCDGACSGNPGPGGWAYIIPALNIKGLGYAANTTNNRMEIFAVIQAVEAVAQNNADDIRIVTDSQYVINTMTKGWKQNKNTDLWNALTHKLTSFKNVEWEWVKGHSSCAYNNECDKMAVYAYKTKAKNQQYFINTDSPVKELQLEKPVVLTPEAPAEIYLTFKLEETFEYKGHIVDIYYKELESSFNKENTAKYYLGIVEGQLITNNCMPMHTNIVVVQNNARYYINSILLKNGDEKDQDLRTY